MTNVVTPGLAVTYLPSTGEQAPATIIGCGDDFILLKCTRNGHGLRANFTSIPQLLMPLMGSEDPQNWLKFACTLFSSALSSELCLG